MNRVESVPPPDYCCVILTDTDGQLVLQKRGPEARRAANQVTCLGGAVESGESPEACIRRELAEEIGHVPERLDLRVVLIVEGWMTVYFYRGELTIPLDALILECGIEIMIAARDSLHDLPVQPWHLRAIEAEALGGNCVVIRT